jgi:hypothetical protein
MKITLNIIKIRSLKTNLLWNMAANSLIKPSIFGQGQSVVEFELRNFTAAGDFASS